MPSDAGATDWDRLELSRGLVLDSRLPLVDLVDHLDVGDVFSRPRILVVILHVPLVEIVLVLLKCLEHLIDHDLSAKDLVLGQLDHLFSQKDVMLLHLLGLDLRGEYFGGTREG